jgi:WD40-like Beta Propeller Repeat
VKLLLSISLLLASTLGAAAAERILMTRLAPSQTSLFVSNADGGGEQKLTDGFFDYDPVWSPDGQWIVFTSERNGSADLYRMRPDGSGVEEKLSGRSPLTTIRLPSRPTAAASPSYPRVPTDEPISGFST